MLSERTLKQIKKQTKKQEKKFIKKVIMLNTHEKYAEIIKISNQLKEKELREKADREFAQSIIIAEAEIVMTKESLADAILGCQFKKKTGNRDFKVTTASRLN